MNETMADIIGTYRCSTHPKQLLIGELIGDTALRNDDEEIYQ